MSSNIHDRLADNHRTDEPSDADYEPPDTEDTEDTEGEVDEFEDVDGDGQGDEDDEDNEEVGGEEIELDFEGQDIALPYPRIMLSPSDAEELLEVLQQATASEAQRTTTAEPAGAQQAAATINTARLMVNRAHLLQLFNNRGHLRTLYTNPRTIYMADDDDDDEETTFLRSRRRGKRDMSKIYPKIPSETGRDLMESGTFGINERDSGQYTRKKKLAARMMRRELGVEPRGKQRAANRLASQSLIPSSNADTIIHYDNRCYSGQFSDDGNFFFSCSQDFRVRMYDTSNPYSWRYYKTVIYPYGQWTITDASLSPDNKWLAYSSIRALVCLASTDPDKSEPHLLDFSNSGTRTIGRSHFGIWSLRFSGDGSEIVAGTSDHSVYVYDLTTRQSVLRIQGHEDDVNAVCFGDKMSPHLLYSGSDDTTLKVWDRRSLGDSRAAGVFLGHTEGLTYIDSKGDGRYVLSNAKDQTMKLWDLRKMVPTEKAERLEHSHFSTGFDYRFQTYDEQDYRPHPHDCSLVTFRGHKVLKTLIRCHFSPPGSTDSRYVYSGSEDGNVYIYNLDATLAGKIDVQSATQNTRPRGHEDEELLGFYPDDRRAANDWKTCVRDCSWHPNAPVLAATSWNGYGMTNGTCTVHAWNDGMEEDEAEPKMGQRVNAQLGQDRRLYEQDDGFGGRRMHRMRMMAQMADD